jgi:hypothetical protein
MKKNQLGNFNRAVLELAEARNLLDVPFICTDCKRFGTLSCPKRQRKEFDPVCDQFVQSELSKADMAAIHNKLRDAETEIIQYHLALLACNINDDGLKQILMAVVQAQASIVTHDNGYTCLTWEEVKAREVLQKDARFFLRADTLIIDGEVPNIEYMMRSIGFYKHDHNGQMTTFKREQ